VTDILKYRFPGRDVVQMKGEFTEFTGEMQPEGFILSNFSGAKIFQFSGTLADDFEISDLHQESTEPLCVSREEYLKSASSFLRSIQEEELGKAVFSRVKRVEFDEKKTFELFDSLVETYPKTLVYLVSSPLFGTWVGATPEVLLKTKGADAYTVSLAGTLPAESLESWTEKERLEQQLVTDFIMNILEKSKAEDKNLTGPFEVVAGPVKHLKTEVRFTINGQLPFDLVKELHPTPAVSGLPREKALRLIDQFEQHDRSLYAGMIGCLESSNTELFVNLRCCSIKRGEAFLYLGGGFTSESDVEKEWTETENKSKTLINVMQLLMA
jgi:isochorismate synthase